MRGHEGQLSGLGWNEVQTPETEYGTEPRKLDRFVYFTAHAAFNFSRAYFNTSCQIPRLLGPPFLSSHTGRY